MSDYFHFDVKFTMNVTDVDDKHVLAHYVAQHPHCRRGRGPDSAVGIFNLRGEEIAPSDFQKAAEEVYASVVGGDALNGSKKPGPDEALINMHTKNGSVAAQVIVEATRKINGDLESNAGLDFYKTCKDILLIYFDSLYGSTISSDDHSIFGKLTKHYEARFM
ncbi:hypothetical protein PHISP_05121 [Aspergillus sp. HF37]|nr:hypothetical protein PHISP_05121 [Aspergillus sp. HF37]